MQRQEFRIKNNGLFRKQCIEWIKQFDTFCLLDSHAHVFEPHNFDYRDFDLVIAAGVEEDISSSNSKTLSDLDKSISKSSNWTFGFFSYDLKNKIEELKSENEDHLQWPDFYFFRPKYLIRLNGNSVIIEVANDDEIKLQDIFKQISSLLTTTDSNLGTTSVQPRMSKEEYIKAVEKIKKHIIRGDIYEMNFCQEFYAHTEFDPFSSYLRLNAISPTPFSCFLRLNDKYLISASPERFIKKRDLKLISQPIKGTIQRGLTIDEDNKFKETLLQDPKERSENIMIVDLVRNDLSKVAARNTVKVDELCGIYSFSHVHQMISTISAITTTSSIEKIIKATFPMGSMTGAPKIRAMKLAEKYETSKRGLYSGAVGYISPNRDFDFNVVIRSLQYNKANNYLSYMVGGAITSLSDAEKEYEECLLKAAAIEKLLKG